MNNIRDSLEILFSKTNPEKVIQTFFEESSPYKDMTKAISKESFVVLSEVLENGKTKDELEAIHSIVDYDWSKSHKEGGLRGGSPQQSVFYVLYNFAKDVLFEKEEKPICEFSQLLRWRDISHKLGEDIFTTSYFAKNDLSSKRERHYFSWLPIISTNNHYLREILEKGVTDIHFHLKGSSLNFDLSWLSLMNHIVGKKDIFLRLRNSKQPDANPWFGESQLSLYALCIKAVAIRQMLFRIIIKDPSCRNKDKGKDEDKDEDKNVIADLYLPIVQSKTEEELLYYTYDLQKETDILSYIHGKKYGKDVVDYAIRKTLSDKNYDPDSYHNSVLWGERWLMYKMFKCIFSGEKERAFYAPLFYAYLIIKGRFRKELIQLNLYPGFRNFQDYQNRKSYFIDKPIYEKLLINLAINNALRGQHVKYLEARVTPQNKLKDNLDLLNWLDRMTHNNSDCHHYIFHFIKKKDEINYTEETIGLVHPRHHKLRGEIKEQTMAINLLRKQVSSVTEQKRLVGVDAAGSEIGCRPEIFAQAYRYLKTYSVELESHFFKNTSLLHLGYTYHVGEDFLDIADGLRAIDEVVKFLNFRGGDRLGHALALGIPPEKYYERKKYRIILPKQDLLDNVVWVLIQIRIHNIPVSQSLVFELRGMYDKLFQEVYGYIHNNSIEAYYYSWLLRGDNPHFYIDYQEKKEQNIDKCFNPLTYWEKCDLNYLPECEDARQNHLAKLLYKSYHYNSDVKQIGTEYCEYKISKDYIQLIRDIQNKMMWALAKKHIVFETNPTSNKLIRQFKHYSEHPLPRFFNLGLTNDAKEISSCPQLSVSINTDDLGVFSTSIENEYALMAIAMEKETDEQGNLKYSSRMIYDWLDRIRSMGFEQRFKRE
jgi:adenosine deaminase